MGSSSGGDQSPGMFYALRHGWSNGGSAEQVGFAPPIIRCGDVGDIGRRRERPERQVRARGVEVSDPCRNFILGEATSLHRHPASIASLVHSVP
jgi:hypothetical protein